MFRVRASVLCWLCLRFLWINMCLLLLGGHIQFKLLEITRLVGDALTVCVSLDSLPFLGVTVPS